jgi:hypothetical protein
MRIRERRTRSVHIKLTQNEYDLIDAKAAPGESATEVARGLLLRAARGPDPVQLAVLAESWLLRNLVMNGLALLAPAGIRAEVLQSLRNLKIEGDGVKQAKARALADGTDA